MSAGLITPRPSVRIRPSQSKLLYTRRDNNIVGDNMEILEKYPVATVLSVVGIVVGFVIPLVYLFALIPEIYLVTREEKEVKRDASFLLGATIVLFIVMVMVWSFINAAFYYY